MTNFTKHEVEWTSDKINNFWNYFVTNEGLLELSYARNAGREIIKIVKPYMKKNGNNLDYGCGAGYLMEYLFENGINCGGLDASMDSVSKTSEKFKNNKYFQGVILSHGIPHTAITDNKYDFVFIIETLEHLLPEQLKSVLSEIYRILKPGGYIFATIPNNENLNKFKVICPDCGCEFHRVQHINRFDVESISALMAANGFTKEFCYATFIEKSKNLLNRLKYIFNIVEAKIYHKKRFTPHLIYLGKK